MTHDLYQAVQLWQSRREQHCTVSSVAVFQKRTDVRKWRFIFL